MAKEYGPYSCEESQVPDYRLPDPLERPDGSRVNSAAEWMNFQRNRILGLFKQYEYGEILPRTDITAFELISERDDALDGEAIRKEIRIRTSMADGKTHAFTMLLYLPKHAAGPVPAFLGLNFKGNHATTDEKDVLPTGHPFTLSGPESFGCQRERWCFRETVRRGYASGTICYHEIHPDHTGKTGDSIFKLFFDEQDYPAIDEQYSLIGAWAWGLSRALDCLEHEGRIDPSRIAVHGHSRLGKTALWAGVTDPRFAMVISNDSGCGGGALHRRKFGENLSQHFEAHTRSGVPCWFVRKCGQFIWNEEKMPMDQHELIALAAPRPICIATATQDQMADPKGEFLAAKAASPVYRLFGSAGLPTDDMPAPDTDISGDISFHYRTGGHDQTPRDWSHYFDLADHYFRSIR